MLFLGLYLCSGPDTSTDLSSGRKSIRVLDRNNCGLVDIGSYLAGISKMSVEGEVWLEMNWEVTHMCL